MGASQVGLHFFKRARRGLYAGKCIRFGNNVSEDGGNKTRRSWKPNVQSKRLYSEALDKMIKLRVTTTALRWIDKSGGLDRYLLNTPDRQLNSDVGAKLRDRIAASMKVQQAASVRHQKSGAEAQVLEKTASDPVAEDTDTDSRSRDPQSISSYLTGAA